MENLDAVRIEKEQSDIQAHKKEMNPCWQRWIAENLMLGHPHELIIQCMIEHGFDNIEAQTEVMRAVNHPYINAGVLLGRKIKKRD